MNLDDNNSHTFDKPFNDYMQAWLWPALPLAWIFVSVFRLSRYSEGSNAVLGFFGLGILMLLVGYYGWRQRITARRIARYHATAGTELKERLHAAALLERTTAARRIDRRPSRHER